MSLIKSVIIIYNPNSTGGGFENAQKLQSGLKKIGMPCKIIATKRRGHAKILAREYAERSTPTMIISSSGDGGYNEIINGILKSKNPKAIVGVLTSGNANDHYHFLHHGNTVNRIKRSDFDEVDVLKLTKGSTTHYAHSYIGLGMTPQIGEILNRHKLHFLKEAWIVTTNLFKVRPVNIRVNGRALHYDHLVFANIARMSKILKVTNHGKMDDGVFEILAVKSGSFHGLLSHLLKAVSTGVAAHKHASNYTFVCQKDTDIQLDGEIINCKRGEKITISCEHKALRTII